MTAALTLKEILLRFTDRKYLVYAFLCPLLIVGSFIILKAGYQAKAVQHEELMTQFREKMHNYRTYSDLTWYGMTASVPPVPLQVLCLGTETSFSKLVKFCVSTWYKEPFPMPKTDEHRNPLFSFFRPVDFPLIVTFILSLMVLAFSYNAVSGERETGTLKLLLSYPVSRYAVILSKLLGGYLVIILPVLFSIAVCALITELSPQFAFTGADYLAVALITAFALVYLVGLYFLGIFISILCRKPSTAIAVLLFIWLVFIVMSHNVGLMITEHLTNPDSVFTVVDQQMMAHKKMNEALLAEAKTRFGVDDLNRMNGDQWNQLIPLEMDLVEGVITEAVRNYAEDLNREYGILRTLSLASPSLLFMTAATDMAGTGVSSHIRLIHRILDFHHYYKETVVSAGIEATEKAQKKFWDDSGTGIGDHVAEFRPGRAPLKQRLADSLWKIGVLALYAGLFFMLAFYFFIRIDVD